MEELKNINYIGHKLDMWKVIVQTNLYGYYHGGVGIRTIVNNIKPPILQNTKECLNRPSAK